MPETERSASPPIAAWLSQFVLVTSEHGLPDGRYLIAYTAQPPGAALVADELVAPPLHRADQGDA
jgi:hypothetical protein